MSRALWPLAVVIALAVGAVLGWSLHRGGGGRAPPLQATPAPSGGRRILYYRSPMNPQQTSPVPAKDAMGMDYVPVYADEGKGQAPQGAVRIDPAVVQSTGVRVQEVQARALAKEVRTVGTIAYDERRIFSVNLKFMGWVDKLYADYTGKPVRRGEPLMDVYSPEVVTTEEELLAASGPEGGQHLLERAKRRLRYWDVPEAQVEAVLKEGVRKTVTVVSPVNGYVIEKSVVQGAQAMPGAQLLKLADLSSIWVMAQVYPGDLPWIRLGQSAQVKLPYLPGQTLEGKVTFISPSVSPDTRTVGVRIEVAQPKGELLRPDMFATVEIEAPPREPAPVVPEQAIIHTGERAVAIVALGDGLFAPREVKLGVAADGEVEILQGLSPGESIVTSSEFLLDSESNLRAALSGFHGDAGAQGMGGANDGGSGP